MIQLRPWKIVLVALAVVFGLLFSLPNAVPSGTLPGWLPNQRLNLGLDLQGGSYLLLEVDLDSLSKEQLTNDTEEVRQALQKKQIFFTGLGVVGDHVSVRISNPAQVDEAYSEISKLAQLLPGGGRDIDVAKTADQTITLRQTAEAQRTSAARAVEQSIEILHRRIDALGTREPSITRQGSNRIVVEAAGESDPEKLKAVIGKTAKLTFQMVDDDTPPAEAKANPSMIPPGSEWLPSDEASEPNGVVVKKAAVVTGEMLTDAQAGVDSQTNQPDINLRFNSEGARKFGDATTENTGKRFAIVLDGKVLTDPRIDEPIPNGQALIHGSFTVESAAQLSLLLRSGALPAKLNPVEQRTVGAELGADAVRAGAFALAVGALAIFAFIILAYGLFGVFAAIALVLNLLLLLAFMSLTQGTLTLPGIAGVILTLAVAVDANVLVFERMRDEFRHGRSLILSLDSGYRLAWPSIFDANVTTLISALIMYFLGSGPVKGFALTLMVGVLTSVFTAMLVTQILIGWWFRTFKPKVLPIGKDRGWWPVSRLLPHDTKFKFTRLAPFAAVLSVLLVIGSAASFATLKLNLGIDFKGGTVIEALTPGPAPLAGYRSTLTSMGLRPEVQGFGAPNDAMIKFLPKPGVDPNQQVNGIKTKLAQQYPGIQFRATEVVGSKVSGELLQSGFTALGIAILLMLGYLWFRFGLQQGLGAVLAVFHDIVLTIGLLSLFQVEFSMTSIAALLTVIGYSMNEKVITFDRLKENLHKYRRTPLREVIDLSENERWSRTLITGTTALLALGGMLFISSANLFPLAFTMVFGIIIGTYSSIYVALPVLLVWGVKRGDEDAKPIAPTGAAKPRRS